MANNGNFLSLQPQVDERRSQRVYVGLEIRIEDIVILARVILQFKGRPVRKQLCALGKHVAKISDRADVVKRRILIHSMLSLFSQI